MKDNQINLSDAIQEFYKLLDKHPDVPKSLGYFTQFLRSFLRIPTQESSLPTIEVMTVLRHRKPVVFSIMRQQRNNVLFSILTEINMELAAAEERLQKIIRG